MGICCTSTMRWLLPYSIIGSELIGNLRRHMDRPPSLPIRCRSWCVISTTLINFARLCFRTASAMLGGRGSSPHSSQSQSRAAPCANVMEAMKKGSTLLAPAPAVDAMPLPSVEDAIPLPSFEEAMPLSPLSSFEEAMLSLYQRQQALATT